jgi:hypothetical protein
LTERGSKVLIPPRRHRKAPREYDKEVVASGWKFLLSIESLQEDRPAGGKGEFIQ